MRSIDPYLVCYAIVMISTLIACWFAVHRADRTDRLPPRPASTRHDPYEVAYLRGGKRAVERLAILELVDSGHLNARWEKGSFWRSRPASTVLEQARDGQELPWHLRAALQHFATPKSAGVRDLWGDQWPGLQAELEDRLRKDQLLAVDEAVSVGSTAGKIALAIGATLSMLAAPKLFAAYGWSVNALIFAAFVLLGLIGAASNPGRLSKRGKAYLAGLRRAYRRKSPVELSAATASGASFALVLGFASAGGETLKDTPYEFLGNGSDADDSGDGGDGGGDD